jgi:hypothetical protein
LQAFDAPWTVFKTTNDELIALYNAAIATPQLSQDPLWRQRVRTAQDRVRRAGIDMQMPIFGIEAAFRGLPDDFLEWVGRGDALGRQIVAFADASTPDAPVSLALNRTNEERNRLDVLMIAYTQQMAAVTARWAGPVPGCLD